MRGSDSVNTRRQRFACEDCDYRWDDTYIKRKDDLNDVSDEEFDINTVCPMCGSRNITQI